MSRNDATVLHKFLIHISDECLLRGVDPYWKADRVLGLSHSDVIDCLSFSRLTSKFIDRIPISIAYPRIHPLHTRAHIRVYESIDSIGMASFTCVHIFATPNIKSILENFITQTWLIKMSQILIQC